MLGISSNISASKISASPFPLLLGFNLYFGFQPKMLLFLVFSIKLVQLRESWKNLFQQWIRASFSSLLFSLSKFKLLCKCIGLMQNQQARRGDSTPQLCSAETHLECCIQLWDLQHRKDMNCWSEPRRGQQGDQRDGAPLAQEKVREFGLLSLEKRRLFAICSLPVPERTVQEKWRTFYKSMSL